LFAPLGRTKTGASQQRVRQPHRKLGRPSGGNKTFPQNQGDLAEATIARPKTPAAQRRVQRLPRKHRQPSGGYNANEDLQSHLLQLQNRMYIFDLM